MASKTGKVTIRGRFSPGTTVKLVSRGSADVYSEAGGDPIATAKTDRNGETTFNAPYGNYFAVATEKVWNHVLEEHREQPRVVDVSIVDRTEAAPAIPPEVVGPEAVVQSDPVIITGARGSNVLDPGTPTRLIDPATGMVSTFASNVAGEPSGKREIPKDGAAPAPRQEDHRGEELASSTLTGEAVPPQPQPPKQEDSPKGMLQASDTEAGVQVPAREVVRQEDFKGQQASDTPTGTAFSVDPDQVTRSASGTGRQVQTGTMKPVRATRKAQGRSERPASSAKPRKKGKAKPKAAKKAAKKSAPRKAAKKAAPRKPAKKAAPRKASPVKKTQARKRR